MSYQMTDDIRLEFYDIFGSLSFSISDLENFYVPNFMPIYLLLLYRFAIQDPLFWISELRTLINNQWYQELILPKLILTI